jgi:hypothetical protein
MAEIYSFIFCILFATYYYCVSIQDIIPCKKYVNIDSYNYYSTTLGEILVNKKRIGAL